MMASSHKRHLSAGDFIPNPFIKKRNLEWSLESPSGSSRPPQPSSPTPSNSPLPGATASPSPGRPSPAATAAVADGGPTDATAAEIEAGTVQISDSLAYFASELSSHIIEAGSEAPRLSISSYAALYKACEGNPHGAHFVIHQHDHPVAGTHYDLRLQINENSSASWAIMYGLPGDPNSKRLNRNATETRIHSLWNHLIETASPETGSLLIWDTGTYTILPRRSKHAPRDDPSSPPGSPHPHSPPMEPPPSLLQAAFQNRKIRLRLHGNKLPHPYVLNLRLTKSEDAAGRSKSERTPRSRRRGRTIAKAQETQLETSSESDSESDVAKEYRDDGDVLAPTDEITANVSAMEKELCELEDAQVRQTNAYPGASNTIGSIHQRKWYLSLDRKACGFVETKRSGRTVWELDMEKAKSEPSDSRLSFPFYVLGPEHERSVVTGRRSEDILRDGGVERFIPRKGWLPVIK